MQLRQLILALFFLILVGCDSSSLTASSGISDDGPEITTTTGNSFRFADYKGKWVLVNYWASWCTPCREEIPALSEFYNKHKDEAVVLGVNMDPMDHAKIPKLIKEFGVTYPITITNPTQQLKLTPEFLPLTVFINPKGEIVKKEVKLQTVESLEASISQGKKA